MLITHDLGVVARLADNVNVMYAGRQAEIGTTDEIFYESRHPYTIGLLASMPLLDDTGSESLLPIPGQPPSLIRVPPGAPSPRCRFAQPDPCRTAVPPLMPVAAGTATPRPATSSTAQRGRREELRRSADEDDLLVADTSLEATPTSELARSSRSLTDETQTDDLDSIFEP